MTDPSTPPAAGRKPRSSRFQDRARFDAHRTAGRPNASWAAWTHLSTAVETGVDIRKTPAQRQVRVAWTDALAHCGAEKALL